jgi:hypothetical protein
MCDGGGIARRGGLRALHRSHIHWRLAAAIVVEQGSIDVDAGRRRVGPWMFAGV